MVTIDCEDFRRMCTAERVTVLPGLIDKYKAVKGRRFRPGIKYLEKLLHFWQTEDKSASFELIKDGADAVFALADKRRPPMTGLEALTLDGILSNVIALMALRSIGEASDQEEQPCIHDRSYADLKTLIDDTELFVRVHCGDNYRDVPASWVGLDHSQPAVLVEVDPDYRFTPPPLN